MRNDNCTLVLEEKETFREEKDTGQGLQLVLYQTRKNNTVKVKYMNRVRSDNCIVVWKRN